MRKFRYLQSCSGSKMSPDVVVPVESKYKSSYEQRLDPLPPPSTRPSDNESMDSYGFTEKIILSLARFIAGNKNARLAVFFYAVLLHGLVSP